MDYRSSAGGERAVLAEISRSQEIWSTFALGLVCFVGVCGVLLLLTDAGLSANVAMLAWFGGIAVSASLGMGARALVRRPSPAYALELRESDVRLLSLDGALVGDSASGTLGIFPSRADYVYERGGPHVPTLMLMTRTGVVLVLEAKGPVAPWPFDAQLAERPRVVVPDSLFSALRGRLTPSQPA
jgi:hypothetical protein